MFQIILRMAGNNRSLILGYELSRSCPTFREPTSALNFHKQKRSKALRFAPLSIFGPGRF